jgi:O-antigen/teichoic acid export membrane protein
VFKESVWRLFTQFVVTIMAVLSSIVVNRLLGPTNKGMYVIVTLATGTILRFGGLGLSAAIAYHVAKKTFAREQVWTFVVVFSVGWGLILGLVGIVVFALLPGEVLKLDSVGKLFLYVGALSLFSNLAVVYLRYYILGNQQFGLFNRMDILRNVLSFVFPVALLVVLPDKLVAMYLAWLFTPILMMIALAWLTRAPCPMREVPWKAMIRVHLAYGLKNYVAQLLQFFNYRLDRFVLNFFLGATQVGLYSVSVSLGEYVWQLSNAVQTVLFPKVAATDEKRATVMTARANRNTVFLSSIAALGLGLFGYWIIDLLYGEEFLPAYQGLLWLLPGVVAFSAVKILYSDLAARGRPEIGSYFTGGAIVATLLFDFLLIPRSGLVGAAQASTLAYSCAAVICTVLYVRITGVQIRLLFLPQREDFRAYARLVSRAGHVTTGRLLKAK